MYTGKCDTNIIVKVLYPKMFVVSGTHDIHAMILGRGITGIPAFSAN